MWEKPPVGAVLGHVAQRNGAVFHPDPSMRKKRKKATERGMHSGAGERQLYRRKIVAAEAAEHGESPGLWDKRCRRGTVSF